ncbi:hypothetical protein [Gluconacetobacter takamatsuzukensis]|uniref:CPBP family intramembrane metalloprotease n=1 Tax=Gluconacetobacter takamatsuzukensis TaxID=1286190 RepID=A0A7W4KDG5_9PROT|nr:hypothetical protein [Gluconacetobacter takamatsuzukensis]MBB2204942.1 hypothetical protein [Gluconacetobacter takamatsuzukensis]
MTTGLSTTIRRAARIVTTPGPEHSLFGDAPPAGQQKTKRTIFYSLAVRMAVIDFLLSLPLILALAPADDVDSANFTPAGIARLVFNAIIAAPLMETSLFHFAYKAIFSLLRNRTERTKLFSYIAFSDVIFFILHLPKKTDGIFIHHSVVSALVIGTVSGSIFCLTYARSAHTDRVRPYLTTSLCHALYNGLMMAVMFL